MKKEKVAPEKLIIDKNIEERNKKTSSRVLLKIIILNLVNLVLVIAIFFLLGELPKLGNSIKEIRSSNIAAEGKNDAVILASEVDRNREKIDNIRNIYVDENGFVEFVSIINPLRVEGIISDLVFSPSAVENSKKQAGVPITMVFQGSRDQINLALEKLYQAPVLFNVVSVELEGTAEAAIYRLSIFLLVDESFPKN